MARPRLHDERGMALIMSIGILMVFTIVTAAAVQYSSSTGRSGRYSIASERASSIAEAGINDAYAILSNASDPRSPSALPTASASFEGGSASWSGTINGDTWTVTSTSTVRNPSGAADLHRTIGGQIRLAVDGTGSAPAWQYVYANYAGCTNIPNNGTVSAPFFVNGNLCLTNSAMLTSAAITVRGTIDLSNSSSIGSSGAPIAALHTVGGCGNNGGPYSLANCNAAHHVYATTVDSTIANVTKPSVDLPYWYLHGKPGPKQSCTSGSFPGGFDNNTVMDKSLSTATLLPSTAYSCVVTSGSSTLGKIVWTPGSPGTLQISGVIFIDGDVNVGGQAIYSGRGTIYSSGRITMSNTDYLCGAAGCNTDLWDGDANMVLFVAGASSGAGFSASNSAKFQGGVYAVSNITVSNSSIVEGPLIGEQLQFSNSIDAHKWPAIDFIADGAPAPIGSTKLIPISGTWSGG